ncbi:hypothetical protein GA372_25375, partial [Bacteroides xylanisolvens]
ERYFGSEIRNRIIFYQIHFNTELPIFISIFLLPFKKNIYLCHTLSAHQRDEIGRKRFIFLK